MLIALPFTPEFSPLPETAQAFGDAARALAVQLDAPGPDRNGGFVMTDPIAAWGMVRAAQDLSPDARTFCEWGAGIGLVAGMAALAGWRAWGQELDPRLVQVGQSLLRDQGLDVALSVGSYKPSGFFDGEKDIPPQDWPADSQGLFAADVTFVYGWPAEQVELRRFFTRHAPEGAILILYKGGIQAEAWRQSGAFNNADNPLR